MDVETEGPEDESPTPELDVPSPPLLVVASSPSVPEELASEGPQPSSNIESVNIRVTITPEAYRCRCPKSTNPS